MIEREVDQLLRQAAAATLRSADVIRQHTPHDAPSRPFRRWYVVAVGASLLVATVVVVLWAWPSWRPPSSIIIDSVASIEAARGVRFSGTTTMSGPSVPLKGSLTGVVDFANRIRWSRVEYEEEPEAGFEFLATDTAAYVRFDPADSWRQVRIDSDVFRPADPVDPHGLLSRLAVTADVHAQGSDTVRGIACERFTSTAEAKDLFPGAAADPAMQLTGQVRVELCIDSSDLLRQLGTTFDVGDGVTQTVLDFYDYGARIDLEAPPDDQIIEDPTTDSG